MMRDEIAFLKELLSIRSVNGTDRELDAAEFLCDYFVSHGIEARLEPIDEKRGNVTAFLPGRDTSRTLLLNGHIDTVPYGSLDSWESDPAMPVEKDGRIYARGASDMKSGLAAYVYALCHLSEKPFCNVLFCGTCDEEKSGLGAKRAKENCREADWILIGEPTDMKLGTAQKGCLWLRLEVIGKTSHGAYPQKGVNAVSCGMRIADGLRDYVTGFTHPLLGSSTAQVTLIEGGVAPNMTPDRCTLTMDVRMTPGLTVEMVLAEGERLVRGLQDSIKKESGDIPLSSASGCLPQVQFDIVNQRRAIEIDRGHPMPACLGELLQQSGYPVEEIGINFFTDASVIDRAGEKDILLFGPGDPAMAHQPNEYVEIRKYLDAIGIMTMFLQAGIRAEE